MRTISVHHRPVRFYAAAAVAVGFLVGEAGAQIQDPVDAWASADITQLTGTLVSGTLAISVTMRESLPTMYSSPEFFSVYVDADQDPLTGNSQPGGIGGVEYQIQCEAGLINSCQLWTLPIVDGHSIVKQDFADIPGAAANFGGQTLGLRLPASALGGASSVDLFAFAEGTSNFVPPGNGDRCPDAGALSTATGTVVVRRPAVAIDETFPDATDDSDYGPDLTAVRLRTFGDQLEVTLTYTAPLDFESVSAQYYAEVTLDTDRSLSTGPFAMGGWIPTWGGDVLLSFSVSTSALYIAQIYLGNAPGSATLFGSPNNDGRWRLAGNSLVLAISHSALDARLLIANGTSGAPGEGTVERHNTDGRVLARVFSRLPLTENTSDAAPDGSRVMDAGDGQVKDPYDWTPGQTIVQTDPEELGISGQDLTEVHVEVIDGNLVVHGILTQWDPSDVDNLFEIMLDTDVNGATGIRFPPDASQTPIGVDYWLFCYSADDYTHVGYYADLLRPDGKIEAHDAWWQPAPNSLGPAGFYATVPLERIGNPASLRLYATAGAKSVVDATGDRSDVAPPAPIDVTIEGSGTCPICGDVTGNGLVQAYDASALLKHNVGLPVDLFHACAADVTGNGEIQAYDASTILRYNVGLVDHLQCPAPSFAGKGATSATGDFSWREPEMTETPGLFEIPLVVGGLTGDVHALELTLYADLRTGRIDGATAAGLPGDWRSVMHVSGDTLRIALAGVSALVEGEVVRVRLQAERGAAVLRGSAVLNEGSCPLPLFQRQFGDAPEAGPYLYPGLPNPFRSASRIRYALDKEADVELAVFDVLGRQVRRLYRGLQPGGTHETTWDGTDDSGRQAAPGVYVCRMRAGAFSASRLLTLVR